MISYKGIPEKPAVYRLYNESDECIWVGSSKQLVCRIQTHPLRKIAHRIEFQRCRYSQLQAMEQKWMDFFRPTLNKMRTAGQRLPLFK